MSHAEEYSADFEEVSGSGVESADTSQFIQSEDIEEEINDDELLQESVTEEDISDKNKVKVGFTDQKNKGEDNNNSEGGASKSTSTLDAVQKFFENPDDDTENAATPDMAEIENIMRKLEKLEQAQSVLETTLNLDWIDPHLGDSGPNLHSSTSVKNVENISEALSAELNSVEQLIKMESKSLEMYKRSRQNSAATSVASVAGGDRSLDDVLKEYAEFEESISADLEDVVKPIPTEPLLPRSKSIPRQNKIDTENFHTNNNLTNPIFKENSKPDKKIRPKSAGKNQMRSQSFTDKFNELVTSEMLKERQFSVESGVSSPKSQSQTETGKYNPQTVYAPQGTNSKPRKKLSSSGNKRHGGDSRENSEMQLPPSKRGAGEGILSLEEILNSPADVVNAAAHAYVIEKLKTEISRQETLIQVYQTDSQNLYSQLKKSQEDWAKDKERYEEEIKKFKTEVASLKVNRLAQSSSNSSPLFGSKVELDRLRDESNAKTELIADLRREILLLRNAQAGRPTSGKKGKGAPLSDEKEAEYQKNIRGLNKQVRTLQKILYSKDPAAASALMNESKDGKRETTQVNSQGTLERKNSQVPVLESRVVQLENELAKADSEAKERLKEFQQKLQMIKNKYEERIKELEHKLEEADSKIYEQVVNSQSLELNSRLEKGQVEINHLKAEISRYKRELEIAAKSTASTVAAATNKQDSATLSLAIKQFKLELADKEKEILKLRKETADLKKTNNNLKREREKYLVSNPNSGSTSGNVTANHPKVLSRAKTDLAIKPGRFNANKSPKKPNSAPKVSSDTVEILQCALETEREEFGKLIEVKTAEISNLEKQVCELQSKVKKFELLKYENRNEGIVDQDVLDDLRERLLTQNKVITALKRHIGTFKSLEAEFVNWKQEKERLEYRNRELSKKCAAAEELRKPENEILLSLSQKVDDLDSRYVYREKQLDCLLNRLSLRTGGGSASLSAVLSPRLTMLNCSTGNPLKTDLDLHQLSLSPSTNFHLLAGTHLAPV